MTLIDLLSQLRAGGLFPIRVESIHELSDDVDFIGSLSEYIEAAKAVQSSYVLVSSFALSEDHFISNNVDVDVDDEEGVEVRIDLCRLVPELGKFGTVQKRCVLGTSRRAYANRKTAIN